MPAFQRLYRAYGRLLRGCGAIAQIAAGLLLLLVVANGLGHMLFGVPRTTLPESAGSLLALLVFLGLALTQYDGGHIRVILVSRRLPPAAARALNSGCLLAGAVFFAWCAYAAWGFADQAARGGVLPAGAPVLWPVRWVVVFGLLLLAVQFLLEAAAETLRPIVDDDEQAMRRL